MDRVSGRSDPSVYWLLVLVLLIMWLDELLPVRVTAHFFVFSRPSGTVLPTAPSCPGRGASETYSIRINCFSDFCAIFED